MKNTRALDFKNQKVALIGLGESGFQAASLLLRHGAIVSVSERSGGPEIERKAGLLRRQGATVEIGHHTENFIAGSRLVVKSPGVRQDAVPIRWARDAGIPVI